MYQTKGINIPEMKWKEKGQRLDEVIKTANLDNEKIVGAISLDNFNPGKGFRFMTKHGGIKQSSLEKFQTAYGKLQALKLRDEDEVINVSIRDLEEENKFLKVKSKLGLEFTLQVPSLENTSRNILPIQLFNFAQEDEIVEVEDTDQIEYFELSLGITDKNKFKSFGRIKEDALRIKTNSLKELLIFSNKGYVYKVPVFLMKNVLNKEVSVETFLGKLEIGEKIVSLASIDSYDEELTVYTFTKKGMIKKTGLKEFEGEYLKLIAHKFKFEDDEVVSAELNKTKLGYLVMITKKGMGIRFPVENVNSMGRMASGVTGISLKDEDEVIFGKYHSNYIGSEGNSITLSEDRAEVIMTSKSKEKSVIKIKDIKLQNRAGRGTNIMMIMLDDELEDVHL
jgi:topoisomerase-4 subunit A